MAVVGRKVCSEDGKRYSSEDKQKKVDIATELHRGGLHSPGRDGCLISGDEMRANGRFG